MKMFLEGDWTEAAQTIEVLNPFDGSVVDTVPAGSADDVDRAIGGAVDGARLMRDMSAYDRSAILSKAAELMREQAEDLAMTISLEEGKILSEARIEVARSAETIQLSAEEAKRIYGEVLPLDAAPGGQGRFGFTLRVPCGVVAAITPFNFPLNLVCHKVGPALAAGNAVVIKPASDTPLSALKLVKILLDAGLPPLAISCVTGRGGEVGDALCRDYRVRKISFTGSRDVGEHICRTAGLKRVTMELGSNSPLIVMEDADLEKVTQATVATGFSNAGQVCISAQRVIALDSVYDSLLETLVPHVKALTCGAQTDEATMVGPMVRESDATRVEQWIDEAVAQGARAIAPQ
jgi:glyceraldehyde-3-phosphate dehydrogenase (NADP+)